MYNLLIMKRIIFLVLFSFCVCNIFAQGKIDTLYYTKEWKAAPNKLFADFYRYTYYPKDTMSSKRFRDYSATGILKREGGFVFIDSLDDSNTIFDGECTDYFSDGQPEYVRNYNNGLLDGEFLIYENSGLVKQIGVYVAGKLTGQYTEFLDNGEYIVINYKDGIPESDSYIKGNANGNMSKFKFSDDTPIWEAPMITERKSEIIDGLSWQFYYKNSLVVAMTCANVNDYGRWHRIDVMISNNGVIPIEFDPTEDLTALSIRDGMKTELHVWSLEEYMEKVERSQAWASALYGLVEGLAVGTAGYSSSTTTSYTSGSVYSYQTGGYDFYSGISNSYTTTYNPGVAYQARVASQQRIDNYSNALKKEREIKRLGYLEKCEIQPNETISGYIYVKRIRGDRVYFHIKLEGASYLFEWVY